MLYGLRSSYRPAAGTWAAVQTVDNSYHVIDFDVALDSQRNAFALWTDDGAYPDYQVRFASLRAASTGVSFCVQRTLAISPSLRDVLRNLRHHRRYQNKREENKPVVQAQRDCVEDWIEKRQVDDAQEENH